MNTLQIIKKQINKAAAVHDAQIAMTTYRGVKCECQQGGDKRPSAIVVTLTASEAIMRITSSIITILK